MITSIRNHLLFSATALVILVGISWGSIQNYAYVLNKSEDNIVNIGIEHMQPLSLRWELSRKGTVGMLQLTQEEGVDEASIINIPTVWERGEVRGISVDALRSEETHFGFTRWYLKTGTSIQFSLSTVPTQVIVHNPSGVQLKMHVVSLDLDTEKIEEDIYLIQKDPVIIY